MRDLPLTSVEAMLNLCQHEHLQSMHWSVVAGSCLNLCQHERLQSMHWSVVAGSCLTRGAAGPYVARCYLDRCCCHFEGHFNRTGVLG